MNALPKFLATYSYFLSGDVIARNIIATRLKQANNHMVKTLSRYQQASLALFLNYVCVCER